MSETSGTAGGYTDEQKACMKTLAELGGAHLMGEEDKPLDGHALHYHAESGAVRHSYPEETGAEEHETLHKAMSEMDGVGEVEHGPGEPPAEEGWVKAFPADIGQDDEVEDPDDEKRKEPAGVTGEEKSLPRGVLARLLRLSVKALPRRQRRVLAKNAGRLRKKGFSPSHAQAIACAHACKAVEPMGDLPGDDMGLDDEVTEGLEEPGAEMEAERGELKQGAKLCQRLIEVLEEEIPLLEQEEIAEGVTEFREWLHEAAGRIYPEVDFGGEGKPAEGKSVEEPGDEAETEEAKERYSMTSKGKRPAAPSSGFWKRVLMKKMSQRACAVIKDAAEHLGDMAEMPVNSQIKAAHKMACATHQKALTDLHAKVSGEGGMENETGVEKDFDADAVLKKLETVGGKLEAQGKAIFQVTGKRA